MWTTVYTTGGYSGLWNATHSNWNSSSRQFVYVSPCEPRRRVAIDRVALFALLMEEY